MPDRIANILVFRVGQLGDTLISLPAIAAIRERHPRHRLVLLTEKQPSSGYVSSWDVLGPTGWFEDVMFYAPGGNFAQRFRTMLALARRIRELRPEIVYDLAPERTARQGRRDLMFFRRLAGVKDYRGGGYLRKPPRNALGLLPRIEPEWRRLRRVIGADAGDVHFHLRIPVAERERVAELLQRHGLKPGMPLVAVGPGSKMPAKMWAEDRFRELGRRLLAADAGLHLLVLGGSEDAAIGERLRAAWGERGHNLAGQLSVYGSAAALERCRAYVGNDTGVMHLAAAVGLRCVALFSARDYPGQWEPFGTNHEVLRHETECAGCMRAICPYDNKCLALISIDEAEHAARQAAGIHSQAKQE